VNDQLYPQKQVVTLVAWRSW